LAGLRQESLSELEQGEKSQFKVRLVLVKSKSKYKATKTTRGTAKTQLCLNKIQWLGNPSQNKWVISVS
jgi:hypothetical protein